MIFAVLALIASSTYAEDLKKLKADLEEPGEPGTERVERFNLWRWCWRRGKMRIDQTG
jgi:hypothetical protein